MNDDALRALIRESIARHLGEPSPEPVQSVPVAFLSHVSHYRYALPPSDGPCLIEPGVACNHCGYCESHGH
jgi:hypothetical protein